MARIGGVTSSHIPAVGNAIANNQTQEPYWKRFFAGYEPAKAWLREHEPDVACDNHSVGGQYGAASCADRSEVLQARSGADFQHRRGRPGAGELLIEVAAGEQECPDETEQLFGPDRLAGHAHVGIERQFLDRHRGVAGDEDGTQG